LSVDNEVSPVVEVLVPSVDVDEDLLGALEEFRNLPRVCDFAGGGEVAAVVVEATTDGGGPERNLPRRGDGGAVVPSAFSAIVKAWQLDDKIMWNIIVSAIKLLHIHGGMMLD